jgi:hypothetical protein
VIAQISRGDTMPDLVSYLFGPGRCNEHVNQHLVAGYADAVFTADSTLWQEEPGTVRKVAKQARELGWQLEYPKSRWQAEVPRGHVWHCSLSLRPEEGPLSDAQWTQAAHALVDALGFSSTGGKAPCRWVAVRHGPSGDGNDHIHIAVSLVREDGTKASAWNDYRKAGQVCEQLEDRFGLQHVPGRSVHRSVPEPSRADREISATRGDPEPLRVRLERTVRACAAAARSEAHFIALARANRLLIRPRYADDPGTRTVTGYAVALKDGRQAHSAKTGITGPVWFGGGKLATDLSLPALRRRWETPGQNPAGARAEALAAWSTAVGLEQVPLPPHHPRPVAALDAVAGDPAAAADLLAAAATACEPGTPGPLSQAARHMARAAQHAGPAPRPGSAAVISEMAGAFQAITQAGTGDVLTLVREVALLADTIAATTRSRAATQASTLVNTSLATLTQAAGQQAGITIPARRNPAKEHTMSELTHEDEFLAQMTAAGVMATRLTRAAASQSPGAGPADVAKLKAAGYTETTPYDEHLRRELGEQRWAWYVADPARIVCAAAITSAARAGHDMPALLAMVCRRRGWEDDQISPARSIARVLDYRIKREMTRPPSRRTATAAPHHQPTQAGRTHGGAPSTSRGTTPKQRPPAGNPSPVTPWDDQLKNLLGRKRWDEYATDDRRRDIAARLTRAAADGHDIDALLTKAVTYRDWEDDPVSPSRRVASVLHYRVQGLIATGEYKTAGQDRQLPSEVAQAVSRSTAPARDHRDNSPHPAHSSETPPKPRSAQPPPGQGRG